MPIGMVVSPYLVGMSWQDYGASPLSVLPTTLLIWSIGAIAGLIGYLFNPRKPENPEDPQLDTVRETLRATSLSPLQIITTLLVVLVYAYLAVIATLVLSSLLLWLGIPVGILFVVLGTIAFRQHLNPDFPFEVSHLA